MSKLLNICKTYSGIREDINEAEEMVITDLIESEFRMIGSEEIGKAFKMNASGKYWETIEAYQTFSPIYVGKVLTAYREWKRKENAKPKLIETAKQLPEPKSDPKRAFEFICKVWDAEGKLPLIASWNKAFKYLEEEGMITISNEEKAAIYEAEKAKVESEISKLRSMMMDSSKLMKDLNKVYLQIQARKTCIKNYLEKNHPIDA